MSQNTLHPLVTRRTFVRGLGLMSATAALAACGQTTGTDQTTKAPAPLLAIIHTNDTHGFDQAADGVLGMAAVAQLKADYAEKGYEVLLFDVGDALSGSLLADDSQGKAVAEFMNACGYDAMTLGNHEFDYGADVLEKRLAELTFPALCANITVDATGEPFVQPHTVFTLSDGTKIGVFGLDTPETMTKSAPKNTAGLTIAQGDDLYACAQKQVDELRAEGCDLVACLGHLGEDESSAPNRASDVIANTEGIDLFIDGHDHKVQNTTIKDKAGNDVPEFETGCFLANIGVITYEDGKFVQTLAAAGEYEGANAELASKIDAVAADIDKKLSKKVGTTPFTLDGEKEHVRCFETNLGDFLADAYRWEAEHALGVKPDAAIVGGGSIRASIAEGDVTLQDIHNACPFVNYVVTIEVTGAQLLEALEAGCQDTPGPTGSFPQVSGITYTIDTSVPYEKGELYPYSTYYAPKNPGSRITISDVNGKGFDLEATYTIAVVDFVATGGDTFAAFAQASQSAQPTGYICFQALQYYLEDECGGVVPDAYAEPQGRVTVKGQK